MYNEGYAVSVLDALRRIAVMDDAELSQTVFSVIGRYRELFPQEDMIFLYLLKADPAERRRIMEEACRLAELELNE